MMKRWKCDLDEVPLWKRVLTLVLALSAIFLWSNLLRDTNVEVSQKEDLKEKEPIEIKEDVVDYEQNNMSYIEYEEDHLRESPFLSGDLEKSSEFTYDSNREEEVVEKSLDVELILLGIITKGERGVALVEKGGETYFLEKGDTFKDFKVKVLDSESIRLSKDGFEHEISMRED